MSQFFRQKGKSVKLSYYECFGLLNFILTVDKSTLREGLLYVTTL